MANGSLAALGLGGTLDLRDEGHTQARALAFVDRIKLERLDFKLANSQGPILPHPHPDAAAPGSVETGVGGRPAPATCCGRATAWRVPRRTPRSPSSPGRLLSRGSQMRRGVARRAARRRGRLGRQAGIQEQLTLDDCPGRGPLQRARRGPAVDAACRRAGRHAPQVAEVLPRLYLRGLSTGDFREALPVLLGEDAAGLSPTNIARLTATWDEDYQAFRRRDLSECDYIYVWVDGIHFNASPFGVVEALDAANGELRWRYRHERESDDLAGIVTTRNLASTTTRSIRRRSTRTSSPSTRGPATSGGTSPAPTTGWGSATRRGPSSSRGKVVASTNGCERYHEAKECPRPHAHAPPYRLPARAVQPQDVDVHLTPWL